MIFVHAEDDFCNWIFVKKILQLLLSRRNFTVVVIYIFLWWLSSMSKEGHWCQLSGVAWNDLVLYCCLFVSGGRIILHTNVQVLPEGSEICWSASKARVCRLMCFIHLTTVRCGIWLGLMASLGTPICSAVFSLTQGRGAAGGPGAGKRSRAFLCLHMWWSPLFVFLRD